MASLSELSLPATVPEMAAYHDREASDAPFTIYKLCDLDEGDNSDFIKTCGFACEIEGQVVRPPRHRFLDGRPRDIVNYHVRLAQNGEFHPRYFVMVTCLEWRIEGVVVVALLHGEMQSKLDLL